jgi:hypothetical protein
MADGRGQNEPELTGDDGRQKAVPAAIQTPGIVEDRPEGRVNRDKEST